MLRIIFLFILISFGVISCNDGPKHFPKIGRWEIVDGDTLFHKIPDFEFIDQDSNLVTNVDYKDHYYIADFFYTTCPSICPMVTKEMLKIYDVFEKDDRIKMISHTLDPATDTPEHLKMYSSNLGVSNDKWQFLTGDKYEISDMAEKYFVSVVWDQNLPDGLDHSGKIILVDKDRHVRAFCEGTDPDSVDDFIKDVKVFLDQEDSSSH